MLKVKKSYCHFFSIQIQVDMVDDTEKRWPNYHPEIPSRMGIISEMEKFDATFFGVPYKQAHTMDPQCRLLIETAYEAILDAGINPKSLRGTKTGVYIGACFVETEKVFFYDQITASGLGITGYAISYFITSYDRGKISEKVKGSE